MTNKPSKRFAWLTPVVKSTPTTSDSTERRLKANKAVKPPKPGIQDEYALLRDKRKGIK